MVAKIALKHHKYPPSVHEFTILCTDGVFGSTEKPGWKIRSTDNLIYVYKY
jgi:hypothetical protein